jgi:hypothetical protein
VKGATAPPSLRHSSDKKNKLDSSLLSRASSHCVNACSYYYAPCDSRMCRTASAYEIKA